MGTGGIPAKSRRGERATGAGPAGRLGRFGHTTRSLIKDFVSKRSDETQCCWADVWFSMFVSNSRMFTQQATHRSCIVGASEGFLHWQASSRLPGSPLHGRCRKYGNPNLRFCNCPRLRHQAFWPNRASCVRMLVSPRRASIWAFLILDR